MTKTVFISGGTRGIGSAAARLFLSKGYRVAISYEKSENIAKAMEAEFPNNFLALQCDMADKDAVKAMFDIIRKKFGGVDILVNNAGIALQKMLVDTKEVEWDRMFDVNVKSMYNTCLAAMDYMVHKKEGKIINISSMWGICGASCEVCYSATKAAVIGFTKALAKELGPSGICVNCVAPGVIDTDMNAVHDEVAIAFLNEETPLGRMGTPEEVARVIEFLAEASSSYITGQVISPNGGFLI